MKRFPVALVFLLGATPALADGPFDGKWAFDTRSCASNEDDTVIIGDGRVTYYESECDIGGVEPIGDSGAAWRAQLTCAGEGETWTNETIFAIDRGTGEERRQLIEINMADGWVVVRQPCD